MWVKGLTWLVADTLKSPTPLQIERYTFIRLGRLSGHHLMVRCKWLSQHFGCRRLILQCNSFFHPGGYGSSFMPSIATEKTSKLNQSVILDIN